MGDPFKKGGLFLFFFYIMLIGCKTLYGLEGVVGGNLCGENFLSETQNVVLKKKPTQFFLKY